MIVHAVVVNWNGGEALLECLRSLGGASGMEPVIQLVDNGSGDGSAEAAEVCFPGLLVRRLGSNTGFAAGANAGIRAARAAGADLVFLLNSDAVLAPGALAALVEAAGRDPGAGLWGGKILQDPGSGRIWCAGVSLGWWPNLCRLRGHGRPGQGLYEREEDVDSLTGCGLLISREVLDRVGLLDERWFVYVEDADFCARARALGFRCRYVPAAVIHHAGAGSTGGGYSAARKYLSAHGAVSFLRRHGTPGLWAGWLLLDLLPFPLLLPLQALRGRGRGYLAKGRGMWDALWGRPADRSVVERTPPAR